MDTGALPAFGAAPELFGAGVKKHHHKDTKSTKKQMTPILCALRVFVVNSFLYNPPLWRLVRERSPLRLFQRHQRRHDARAPCIDCRRCRSSRFGRASPRWDCRSQLEVEKVRKGGFAATYFRVEAPEETRTPPLARRRSDHPARPADSPAARSGAGASSAGWPRRRRPFTARRSRRFISMRWARSTALPTLSAPRSASICLASSASPAAGADRRRDGPVRSRPDAGAGAGHGRAAQGRAAAVVAGARRN